MPSYFYRPISAKTYVIDEKHFSFRQAVSYLRSRGWSMLEVGKYLSEMKEKMNSFLFCIVWLDQIVHGHIQALDGADAKKKLLKLCEEKEWNDARIDLHGVTSKEIQMHYTNSRGPSSS